jgi:hypothetical protein
MTERFSKTILNSSGVVLRNPEQALPAASEFIGRKFQIKNRNQIYNHANELSVQWPNHSLNLTEGAVDDFAARCWTDLEHLTVTSAQRTTWN